MPRRSTYVDPANERAEIRSNLGLTRELQQPRTNVRRHPRFGGTRGYDTWFREDVLESAAETSVRIAAQRHRVCEQSIRNWRERLHPYRMVGGMGEKH